MTLKYNCIEMHTKLLTDLLLSLKYEWCKSRRKLPRCMSFKTSFNKRENYIPSGVLLG